MKLLFDFLPVIFFYLTFELFGIYTATIVGMITAALQFFISWVLNRKIEFLYLFMLIIIFVLGGATLILQDDFYIKWKPTFANWLIAGTFLITQWMGSSPLIEKIMGEHVHLPKLIWYRLNLIWVLFFLTLGLINIYVIYNFDTTFWVRFKVIGNFGLVIVFIILQAFYMSSHMENEVKK